jgi:hypothetical protein
MRLSRRLLVALPLGMMACEAAAPPQTATLPRGLVQGTADPLIFAVTTTASNFSAHRRMEGMPALAAQNIALMEFIAVRLPADPRYAPSLNTLGPQLTAAKREWRGALGIPADVPAQPVIDALLACAAALDLGDQAAAAAALPPAIFTRGGVATLAILADLPPLPATNVASANARSRRG